MDGHDVIDDAGVGTQLLACVVGALAVGAVVLDSQRRVVLWNDWMARHSNHAPADIVGRDFFAMFPEQAGRRLEGAVRQALRDNFPAVLSQSLHKAPLPLFADSAARDAGCRMRQAIAVTPFDLAAADSGAAQRYCLVQISDVSGAVLREKMLRSQALALREQSISDGLTGIANRRYFDQVMAREMRRARRSGRPLSLLMIDIDFFKDYNDRYGHQRGDAVLVAVATALAARLQRPMECLARYGGEEFAVILPETALAAAAQVAEMLRERVARLQVGHSGKGGDGSDSGDGGEGGESGDGGDGGDSGDSGDGGHVTVSIGVACWTLQACEAGGAEASRLIGAADRALYAAKARGRNCVALADDTNDGNGNNELAQIPPSGRGG